MGFNFCSITLDDSVTYSLTHCWNLICTLMLLLHLLMFSMLSLFSSFSVLLIQRKWVSIFGCYPLHCNCSLLVIILHKTLSVWRLWSQWWSLSWNIRVLLLISTLSEWSFSILIFTSFLLVVIIISYAHFCWVLSGKFTNIVFSIVALIIAKLSFSLSCILWFPLIVAIMDLWFLRSFSFVIKSSSLWLRLSSLCSGISICTSHIFWLSISIIVKWSSFHILLFHFIFLWSLFIWNCSSIFILVISLFIVFRWLLNWWSYTWVLSEMSF